MRSSDDPHFIFAIDHSHQWAFRYFRIEIPQPPVHSRVTPVILVDTVKY